MTYSTESNNVLMIRAKKGNDDAIVALVENNKDLIYDRMLAMKVPKQDQEDVFHNIKVELIEYIDRFDWEYEVTTIIGRKAEFTAKQYWKKTKKKQEYTVDYQPEPIRHSEQHREPTTIDRVEISNAVQRELSTLELTLEEAHEIVAKKTPTAQQRETIKKLRKTLAYLL